MFCRFCGKEAQDDQNFCPYCGKKDEAPIKNEESVFVPPVRTQPVQSIPAYESQMNQPAPAEKKKKSKLPLILVAVILVATIVLGVIFAPRFLNRGNGEGKEKDTVTVWVMKKVISKENNYAETIEFEYNEKGLLSKEVREHSDSEIKTTTYTYDDRNNLIEIYYADSECLEKHQYDENDNLISITDYYNGEASSSISYEYDEYGNMTYINNDYMEIWCTYDSENRLIKVRHGEGYTEYEYDSNGNLVYESEYDESYAGIVSCCVYEYDNNNQLIKESFYQNGRDVLEGSIRYTYKYDSSGNLIEMIQYAEGQEDERWVYEYDDNGNVVHLKVTALFNGDGYSYGDTMVEVEIEYKAIEVSSDIAEDMDKISKEEKLSKIHDFI